MPKTITWISVNEIRSVSLIKNALNIWEITAPYTVVADDGFNKAGTETVTLPQNISNQVETLVNTQLRKRILAKELNE